MIKKSEKELVGVMAFQKTGEKNLDESQKYKHLWLECENCYGLN